MDAIKTPQDRWVEAPTIGARRAASKEGWQKT